MKNMKIMYSNEQYKILKFTPSIFKLFYNNMEKISLQRRIRFLLELIRGYNVYYLMMDNNLVAYTVVSKGGGRYSFASNEDIVVGPYFVREQFRRNRYSETLIGKVLELCQYRYAYDWIRKDNIPSLKCSMRVGFHIVKTADVVKPFRCIVERSNKSGEYYILKYKK